MEAPAFLYASSMEYVTPEQLADLWMFTASPRGWTISGQTLAVCGDTTMMG